ncbi:protein Mpv17-like [Rhipicephalus sanguineus]|nr:protein Mpv17-like [Rhipicephalus sanguineus]
MQNPWNVYARLMRRHPAKTQVLTTATVLLSGDLIAQKVLERRSNVDVVRAARFFVMGVGFVGPVIRMWHLTLERVVGSGVAGSLVFRKVLIDQVLFAPVFIASLLVVLGTLQRRSWDDIENSLRANYLQILKTSYMLWPAAQLINFRFVPLSYRPPFAGCVAVVWSTYLAWKANRMQNTQRAAFDKPT